MAKTLHHVIGYSSHGHFARLSRILELESVNVTIIRPKKSERF